MADAYTLQQKYKPRFKLPENSVLRLHKVQYRNQHYSSERLWHWHMHHGKPRTGHVQDWNTDELQNMSSNIDDRIKKKKIIFLYAENLGVQNMPKSYE